MILRAGEHRAEAETRRDSERFAYATLDALSEHVAVLDERGTLIAVNRAWREFAEANSLSPEGLNEGANYFAACERAMGGEAGDAARFAAGLRSVIGGELDMFSLEYPCHSPTRQRWFVARATRFELDGEIRAVVTHVNIIERKLAEEELRRKEERFRVLFELGPVAVFACDRFGVIQDYNRRAAELWGREPKRGGINERYCGSFKLYHPDGRLLPHAESPIVEVLRTGVNVQGVEVFIERPDGSRIPVIVNFSSLKDERGEVVGTITSFLDISARKKAEEALRESEEWLRAILDASRDGMLVEDDERIVYVNSAYARLFGYEDPDELTGKHISAVLSAADEERMLAYGRRRVRGEAAPTVYEFKGRCKDGELVDMEASVSISNIGGKAYITTAIRDISERKLAEEALRRSESKYRLLMEQASDGIHTYDLRGNIIETNSKLCEMLGHTREELLRLNVTDLIPPEDLAVAPIRFGELRAGRTLLTERRLRRKDGTLLPVEISGRMIQDGVLQSIIRDISERKRAEDELRKAYDELERRVEERTAELARVNEALQAEVAERRQAEEVREELLRLLVGAQEEERRRISMELHDQMGQHLTALMMGLKTLSADSHGRRTALADLQQLLELTDDLSREVHTLAWSLRPPALDDLGLHTALYNYVEEWAERSRVVVDFHSAGIENERLPLSHETTVYRIAQEALTNVVKHSRAQRVSVILERHAGQVLVVIADDGEGFDVEALMKLSVKERQLGLLGMRERAALLGGTLNIDSTPGAGTSVSVRLPVGAGCKKREVSE